MKPATWIIVFVSVVSCCFGAVAFLNWWADPISIYNHENSLLKNKYAFDERLQKTNAVKFGEPDYDAILLGSSVSTYINQNHFEKNRVFNYSASAMRPEEFPGYIKYFKQEHGDGVTTVILSADFLEYFVRDYHHNPPESYADQVSAPGYRLKELLSLSQVSMTLKSLRYQKNGTSLRYYEPGNVANIVRPTPQEVEKKIMQGILLDSYNDLEVDSDYETHLDETIAAAGKCRIVVFTTPISHFRTNLFFERGKKPGSGDWLKLLVRKFGTVYHFADINSITSDHQNNYYDSYHFYPEIGDMIIKFIESEGAVKVADFGVVLNSENIDTYLGALGAD